jgi:xanthine/CO dehydrogenase XdhC/CoxF family maturation factor
MRRLIIIGRGITAERLAVLAGQLGYEELTVTEGLDQPLEAEDHVVIAEEDTTRARDLLHTIATGERVPAYVGYAAPHKEGWKALVALAARNVPKARIDAVSAPAGVDVGAETPDEVAIAVAAELVALRHGRARPSAGMDITPARRPALVEARPRRLIGALTRREPAEGPDDEDDNGEGRN